MNKKENLLEDAVLQIKTLEESLKKNAKGILASTMKEEIRSLVKESLKEQDEEEIEDEEMDMDSEEEVDMDSDDMSDEMSDFDETEMDMDSEDEVEMDLEDEPMMDDEDETSIDLRGVSDAELLKVFKRMKDTDGITVEKNAGMLKLQDTEKDAEYLVQLGEGYDYDDEELMEFDSKGDVDSFFNELDEEMEDDMDETIYELEMDEEMEDDMDETIYELEMDEEMEDDMDMDFMDETIYESKGFKAKGNVGKLKKVDFKSNTVGGFNEKRKEAFKGNVKAQGTGKAKFDYKDGENLDGEFKVKPKKVETKEASRTYGSGSKFRKGGLPKPRAHSKANTAINEELSQLKSKNDEYRKALDVFRTKLNEVAIFNSNLAYATRLFTEHSTTKQEKLNILKRFDNVETIKESKNLYKTIKEELATGTKTENTITESIERKVNNVVSNGSAVNLIESKTYENPQFLRMKDLMGKIK
jgi:hypothetical protein